jgi:hypothetical protein
VSMLLPVQPPAHVMFWETSLESSLSNNSQRASTRLTSREGSCCRRRSSMPSVTTSMRVAALTWK